MEKFENCLGFGQYRDLKLSKYGNVETNYLLWVLKNVRLPKLLWETIISYLDTKIIINTNSCIDSIDNLSEFEKKEVEKLKLEPNCPFKINLKEFLEPRIEPEVEYTCNNCNAKTMGYPSGSKISNLIKCCHCDSQIIVPNIELRFYFGWYFGWRFIDFETEIDKDYLRWILENLEFLTPEFKNGIKQVLLKKSTANN